MGDQVISGVRATLLDIALQKRREFGAGTGGGKFCRMRAAGLINSDHRVRPAQQIGGHHLGNAQKPGDDDHRQLLREMRKQIEPPLRQRIDQVVRQRRNFRR